MSPIRVAFVITELRVGGAERCLSRLAAGLHSEQFQIEVYSLAPAPPPERSELVELLRERQIPTHFLDLSSPWQFRTAVRLLRQALDRQQPAIVQSFLFHANVVASLAATPWPAMRVVHGLRVADPRAWRHWVERIAARRADKVVCVSDAVARFARTRSRIDAAKIVTIANGVDCDFVDAQPATPLTSLGLAPNRRAIAALGRLEPQKGFDWLLEAAAVFLPQLSQHDLILVGDGPERASLTAQAKRLEIADRVWMPGWRNDAIGILKACDLFVMTSRWEGMPNALLEAMACSLPVVATRVEGVEEVVAEFPDRQLVSSTDTDGLVHRVVKLVRDQALAEELAATNRWQIQQRFSLEQMIARYRQLYERLLHDD